MPSHPPNLSASTEAAHLRLDCLEIHKSSKVSLYSITKEEYQALMNLKEDKSVAIVPADKSRSSFLLKLTKKRPRLF